MATSRQYFDYIADQLSGLDGVSFRKMMGEYLLYFQGKIIGGLYDNRFLVKPVRAAESLLPDATRELPYEGAKPMLLVTETDDRAFLRRLLPAIADELPEPKK